jgi:ankyrin repeat protein
MMFGHGLRNVTVGRGGKEGNAAFLKDSGDYKQYERRVPMKSDYNCILQAMQEEMFSCSILDYYISLDKDSESSTWKLLSNIELVLRCGNLEISGKLISMAVKKGGYGFNFLHEQSVTYTDEPFTNFKPVSVVKKSIYTSRVTPLHCAAINPNPYYLQTLLNCKPEYTILDRNNWMPVHYAAVCVGVEPLKLLLSRGVSTMTPEKEGNTPLHLASSRGRVENVEAIIEHELQNLNIKDEENEEEENKTSNDVNLNSSLEKVNKMGMRPLHIAIQKGHVNVVKALLNHKADAEKFTPAQLDKLTPLMIACQQGHLEIVKILVNHGVKLAATDRRGRTATAHAVINGHANVLSYLLRLGVNPNVTDSSGNTLAHYAAAYGWYFNLKLLLEAGCDVAKGNDWKLTPLAVAFLKGHIGIVEMLVKEPGVEVNTPVDGDSGENFFLYIKYYLKSPIIYLYFSKV